MLWSYTSSFAIEVGNKYLRRLHLLTSMDVSFWKPWIPSGTFFHTYVNLDKSCTFKVFNWASTAMAFSPSRSNTTSSESTSSNSRFSKFSAHKMVLDEKSLWEIMGVDSGNALVCCWMFVTLCFSRLVTSSVPILPTWWIHQIIISISVQLFSFY